MGRVLVSQVEYVLLDKGYGSANLEWAIPGNPGTKYRIDSIGKQFTATLILLLQQDGEPRITDPVSRYLPGEPKAWEG